MTCFDHDGRPTAVDFTHPVDVLEPEEHEEPDRGLSAAQFRDLVIEIETVHDEIERTPSRAEQQWSRFGT